MFTWPVNICFNQERIVKLTGYLRLGSTRSPSLVFICDYLRHPPQKDGRLVHQLLLRVALSTSCNKMADKNVEKLFRSYFRNIPSH